MGTEGWADARWRNLIYAARSGVDRLQAYGLAPYVKHPLIRCVALPWRAQGYRDSELLSFLSAVDEDFRFLMPLAPASLDPLLRRANGVALGENPNFLHFSPKDWERMALMPLEMLGKRLGALILRIGPFDRGLLRRWRQQGDFATRLESYLTALKQHLSETSQQPQLALEIQNGEWLTPRLMKLLASIDICPVLRLSLGMPNILRQQKAFEYWRVLRANRTAISASSDQEREKQPLFIHWAGSPSLSLGYRRLDAQSLVASDPLTRAAIASLIIRTVDEGDDVWVWVENRAEGSAPLTLKALAEALVARRCDMMPR